MAKHWNQKYRKLRAQKVIKVNLPDYEETMRSYNELSKEEMRSKMKEKGVQPSNPSVERPLYLSTTGDIFEPYVPPEGDGKVSFITKEVNSLHLPCQEFDRDDSNNHQDNRFGHCVVGRTHSKRNLTLHSSYLHPINLFVKPTLQLRLVVQTRLKPSTNAV
ncbi:39S ribosomal protein L45, mitochondrial [Homalodisca vitripennis]|nr:39S ribosomal protein L45, mitochondrial [Homalodisca vitripennis]